MTIGFVDAILENQNESLPKKEKRFSKEIPKEVKDSGYKPMEILEDYYVEVKSEEKEFDPKLISETFTKFLSVKYGPEVTDEEKIGAERNLIIYIEGLLREFPNNHADMSQLIHQIESNFHRK